MLQIGTFSNNIDTLLYSSQYGCFKTMLMGLYYKVEAMECFHLKYGKVEVSQNINIGLTTTNVL